MLESAWGTIAKRCQISGLYGAIKITLSAASSNPPDYQVGALNPLHLQNCVFISWQMFEIGNPYFVRKDIYMEFRRFRSERSISSSDLTKILFPPRASCFWRRTRPRETKTFPPASRPSSISARLEICDTSMSNHYNEFIRCLN